MFNINHLGGRGRYAGFPAPPAQIPSMRNYRTGLLPQVMTHRRFCCLPYLAKLTLQGFPALCPAPVLLDRFPLVSPLFSASSAIRLLSRILFKGILDTIRLSDFRKQFIPVVRFSPSLAVPPHTKENSRISRFPRKECPHMPSSSTPPGRSIARIALQLVLPSQSDHVVGTRKLVISELNSPPVLPSVNASATALLQLPHDSRLV